MNEMSSKEWQGVVKTCQRLSACLDIDSLRQHTAKILFELFDAETAIWVIKADDKSRVVAVYPSSRKEVRSTLDPIRVIQDTGEKFCWNKFPEPLSIPPFTTESIMQFKFGDGDYLIVINPSPDIDSEWAAEITKPIEAQIQIQQQLVRHVEKAQKLALLDDLTGLYNVRYFRESLEREWQRGERYKAPFSILFIDLDDFKQLNDKYGHLTGSAILQEIGDILKDGVRSVDTVFRYGGDEFTVILPNCGPDDARGVADRLKELINERRFASTEGKTIRLTSSIGMASYPVDGKKIQQLLEAADKAMYKDKPTQEAGA